jgi:hypothetical protein
MIMAALHTVNYKKLSLTRYQLFAADQSGSEKVAAISNFGPVDETAAKPRRANKRKPNDFRVWRKADVRVMGSQGTSAPDGRVCAARVDGRQIPSGAWPTWIQFIGYFSAFR